MKYRAILSDPGNKTQERPQQMLTNSRSDVTIGRRATAESGF